MYFDINFSNQRATKYIQYMLDGYYVDSQSTEFEVDMLLYNGQIGSFTYVEIIFKWQPGGTTNHR